MSRAPHLSRAPSPPGRRAVVGGLLASVGLGLAGCRVQWEDSAPQIPFNPIPTREPIPAEDALLWLLGDSHDLAQAAVDPAERSLYEEQVAVLRTALYRAGIPIETVDETLAAPTTSALPQVFFPGHEPSASGRKVSFPKSTFPSLGRKVESPNRVAVPGSSAAAALRRVDELARSGAGLFPLVMSLLAQRWAAVLAAGATIPPQAQEQRAARRWSLPLLAVPFWQLTDAAVYGFEVVAAQSQKAQREAAMADLARIQDLLEEQDIRSGPTAKAPTIAYPLPFAVDSPGSAATLAEYVSRGLLDGYAGLLPTVAGTAQQETARDVLAWLGTATSVASRWGVPVAAFPGTATEEDAEDDAEKTAEP